MKVVTPPGFPQQVTKAHEPPREDAAPPKPAVPAPPPPQHLQPESDSPQQPGSSPRGKSRSPVPPAEKEGECVSVAPGAWGRGVRRVGVRGLCVQSSFCRLQGCSGRAGEVNERNMGE